MTNLTDDIEALLESEEKVVRAREDAEDKKKEEQQRAKMQGENKYSFDREENDRRRARKSGDNAEDTTVRDMNDEGPANGNNRNRRAHVDRSSRGQPRSSYSPKHEEPMEAPSRHDRGAGDYYNGGGRPARADEYRPGSRGGRDSRARSPNRGRSRSPPRRNRSRDGNYRDRSRGGRGDYRGGRRPQAPPEPTDDERDRRTVFVQQLAVRLRTKDLSRFFEQAGEVVEAQIVKDRVSNRSKGYV